MLCVLIMILQHITEYDMYKITRIKERVEEKEGIPPAQQRLVS
jgi:hypothetical protein